MFSGEGVGAEPGESRCAVYFLCFYREENGVAGCPPGDGDFRSERQQAVPLLRRSVITTHGLYRAHRVTTGLKQKHRSRRTDAGAGSGGRPCVFICLNTCLRSKRKAIPHGRTHRVNLQPKQAIHLVLKGKGREVVWGGLFHVERRKVRMNPLGVDLWSEVLTKHENPPGAACTYL